MAFNISTINDVIAPEAFEAQKAVIKAQYGQKAPSTTLPRRAPANVPAEQLKMINSLMDTSYDNSDWLVFSQSCQGLDGMGISKSELVTVRSATASALAATEDPHGEIFSMVMQSIAKHPTFGDLYIALAGLKLQAAQIENAVKLIELVELCPRYHKIAYNTMHEKLTLILPEWKNSIPSWLVRYVRPSVFEKLSATLEPELIEKAMPAITKIRDDPSCAFEVWQSSPELRKWCDEADHHVGLARCAYPMPEVPQEHPLISLDPKITTQILEHLDMTSVLNLRTTCAELLTEISYSDYWVGVIESKVGLSFASLPAYIRDVPMSAFSGVRSVLMMTKTLAGPSNFGPLAVAEFSSAWLSSAEELVEVCKSMSPGTTWESMALTTYLYRIQALICLDLTGTFVQYLDDHCPGTFSVFFRFLRHPNPIAVSCALQTFLAVIVSASPRRNKWVAMLRHWRLGTHLSKFGVHRQGAFSHAANLLLAAIESADSIDCDNFARNLKLDLTSSKADNSFKKTDFDGLWWISRTEVRSVGLDRTYELFACNLEWTKEEETDDSGAEKVTFSGAAYDSLGREYAIDGAGDFKTDTYGFQLMPAGPEPSYVFDAVLTPYGLGGIVSDPQEEPGVYNPTHGFFMWRDSRPVTPELWEEASTVLVKRAEPATHKPAWFDEDSSAEAHRSLMAIHLAAGFVQTAGHFANFAVVEQAALLYEVPSISEQVNEPAVEGLVDSLVQDVEESDDAFSTRKVVYVGGYSILTNERFSGVIPFLEELPVDLEIMAAAITRAYASLPEDVLFSAGIISTDVPELSSKRTLTRSMDGQFDAVMRHVYTHHFHAWADPVKRPAHLEALAKVIDAIIGDFNEDSPLRDLYFKWTSRLCWVHPSVSSADSPFSFEELCVLMSATIFQIEQERQQGEREDNPFQWGAGQEDDDSHADEDSKAIFSDALKRNSRRKGEDSTVTTVVLVATAAIATIALGVGAFFLGRRLSRD